jgi:hypothetical protein
MIINLNNSDNTKPSVFCEKLKKLSSDINEIFCNINDNIKQKLLKLNIKTRNYTVSFVDALCYIYNYSFINNTKKKVVANYNCFYNKKGNRTSYYRKEFKIPLSFYTDILNKVKKLLKKYSPNCKYTIFAGDGTYNITNANNGKELETNLNMGFFNVTNCIPVDIEYKGYEKKNKEIASAIEYINSIGFNIKNVILVFDRAYFCYDFINFLDQQKINYVIRVKNNCVYINKPSNQYTKINNKQTRIIQYLSKRIIERLGPNKKLYKLEETIECNLITNLNTEFNNEQIKQIYVSRWDVEVFFKLLKSNFKFAVLREHSSDTMLQYKKKYLIILTILHLIRLIEIVFNKFNKKIIKKHKNKHKKKHKYKYKNDSSLMIEGFKMLIYYVINSKLDVLVLSNYCSNYISKISSQLDISNPRKSKIPFSKWYVKLYHECYKYETIINAIINNEVDKLEKNLKVLALKIKIIR